MQNNVFEILVQIALFMEGFLRDLKITPESALLSLTLDFVL